MMLEREIVTLKERVIQLETELSDEREVMERMRRQADTSNSSLLTAQTLTLQSKVKELQVTYSMTLCWLSLTRLTVTLVHVIICAVLLE
jgi:hypothetical protein